MNLTLPQEDRIDEIMFNLAEVELNDAIAVLDPDELLALHAAAVALAMKQMEIASKAMHALARMTN